MNELTFDVPISERSGRDTALFIVSVVLAVTGVLASLTLKSAWPLLASAAGMLAYCCLLCISGQIRYVPYMTIGESGITYVHTPARKGRTSRYAWSEIAGVTVHLAEQGSEFQGLGIQLRRPSLGGVPFVVGIHSHSDTLAAMRAATHWLELEHAKTIAA